MNLAGDTREPTLAVLLERAATRVTDAQAALACGTGTAATAGILLFAPGWWRVALATLSLAAFGASVVVARSGVPPRTARLVHATMLTLGVAAAFGLGLSVLTKILGVWIS